MGGEVGVDVGDGVALGGSGAEGVVAWIVRIMALMHRRHLHFHMLGRGLHGEGGRAFVSAALLATGGFSGVQRGGVGCYAEAFGSFGEDSFGDGPHVGLGDGPEGCCRGGDVRAGRAVELDELLLAASCAVGAAGVTIV